ncbi:MAG TPA: O-methyltransferase [Ignavibacteriaceae bacterium]|nr:O-methyltransferase [Ignavibacteriaceae bacterium]
MEKIIYPSQLKYLQSFGPETDPLILELEDFAEKNSVPILSKDSARLLEILISMTEPKRVLELGTAIAYSSIIIARKLKKKGILHTIEKSQDNIKLAKENISKAGLNDKIILMEGNAFDVMPRLDKKYDFIFLDADKRDYKRLFDYCLILLKKDGIIFVDNLLWKGYAASPRVPADQKSSTNDIREFNKIFTSQKSLMTTILPVGDGIGLGIKL